MKKSNKFLAIVILMIAMCGAGNAYAQDKYGFGTWSNEFMGTGSYGNTYYLVISDPVKNMGIDGSKEKSLRIENWRIDFRVSANNQAGFELMRNYQDPGPACSSYECYSSLSQCKEAIQNKVNKFKQDYATKGEPIKIIYVNP